MRLLFTLVKVHGTVYCCYCRSIEDNRGYTYVFSCNGDSCGTKNTSTAVSKIIYVEIDNWKFTEY